MLNENDLRQLSGKGITQEKLDWQISVFKKGVTYVNLSRPAIVGDGIVKFDRQDLKKYIGIFQKASDVTKIKFVPASGAASRMFKVLFEYLEDPSETARQGTIIEQLVENIEKFAFYEELEEVLSRKGMDIQQLRETGSYVPIIKALLNEDGLDYGSLPKGLLKFHAYEKESRTPFEEHLYEAAKYAASSVRPVNLHFTVSPEHMKGFTNLVKKVVPNFERIYGVEYNVSFSIQNPSTDTLAVDMNNEPFRNSDKTILFRPGGHGALLDNLNELKAEIIFVKNIDNVVPEKYFEPTFNYKRALAGKLLELRKQVYTLLEELEQESITGERLMGIYSLIVQEFCYQPKQIPDHKDPKAMREFLFGILNRPIRVCGVVKNMGEPGGGPFWAPNSRGDITLQIIESSQVDPDNKKQMQIFKSATHFNPVDLVCCPYGYKGQKFNLHDYVDETTCFISHKSKDGRELKALELPGLWNGAMADWLTVFVEVPIETFNPVKTVNDLLRPQHQQNVF